MAPEAGDSLPAVDSPGRQGIFTSTLLDPWWKCVDSKRLSHAYVGHVWQYTSKDLQYDQGALAAFRGIIAAGVVDKVWGLPLRNEILIWQGYKSARNANRNLAVALA